MRIKYTSLRAYVLPVLLCVVLITVAWKFDARASSVLLTITGLATELRPARRRSDPAGGQKDSEFRTLVEMSGDCIVIVDPDLAITSTSPAITRIFGYAIDEIIGQSATLLFPELKAGDTPEGEVSAIRKDGVCFDVRAMSCRIGENTTIILRDISELKHIQRRLENSEEGLRLTLDSIPGLIYTRLPDGKIEYANRQCLEFFGKSVTELQTDAWIPALHPDEREGVLWAVAEDSDLEEPFTMEYRSRRFDGIYRRCQTRCEPLRDPLGRVIRWYCLLTDIEDRKMAEDTLKQTEAALSKATQTSSVSEFAASVVHETVQPLSAIVTNAQTAIRLLSLQPSDISKVRGLMERIVRDGKDSAEIIHGLRSLYQRSSSEKSELDMRHIVKEVVERVRSKAAAERIHLQLHLPEDLLRVYGDRVQLQQTLLNLVSNAIDSMHSNSDDTKTLVIRSKLDGDVILTEVEDQGVGIANIDRIFDKFYTTKTHGTGMGLCICRTIVDAHRGRLWCSPGTARGAVFSFTIPHSGNTVA